MRCVRQTLPFEMRTPSAIERPKLSARSTAALGLAKSQANDLTRPHTSFLLLVRMLLAAVPGAPNVASLLLVVRPGAPSSFLHKLRLGQQHGDHQQIESPSMQAPKSVKWTGVLWDFLFSPFLRFSLLFLPFLPEIFRHGLAQVAVEKASNLWRWKKGNEPRFGSDCFPFGIRNNNIQY